VALLPQVQPLVQANFPNMQITTQSMVGADLEQALKEDEFDIVFTNTPSQEYDITSHRLFGQSLIAAFPHSHPQAAVAGNVSLAALTAEKIVVDATSLSAAALHRLTIDQAGRGVIPDAIYEAGNFFEAIGLILSGNGIGLFDASFLRLMPSGLVVRKLDSHGPQLDVVVLHRAGLATSKLGKLLHIFQKLNVLHS
jgi:DNA-binding transcriptional LysR family regulator